jgi:trimeric autotransporter adhesin
MSLLLHTYCVQAEVDITNRARESAVQEANKLLYTQHYSRTAASIVDVDSAILWRERALRYEEQLSRLGITLAPHAVAAAASSNSSTSSSSSAAKACSTLISADFSASRKTTAAAAAAAAAAAGGSAVKQRSSAAHREHVVASRACFEHSMLVQQGVSQRLEQQLSRAKQALAAAQAAAAAQTQGSTAQSSSSTTSAAAAATTDTVHDAATDAVIEETVVQPEAATAATAAASETASGRVQATLIANATAQAQRRVALQQRTGGSPNAITDTSNSSSSAELRCEFSTAYTSAAHSFRNPNKAQLQRPQLHGSSGSDSAGAAGLRITYEPKSPELRSWLAQHRAAAQRVRTLG